MSFNTLRKNEISDSFIKRGDKLLYEAKRCRKNKVVYETEIFEEA